MNQTNQAKFMMWRVQGNLLRHAQPTKKLSPQEGAELCALLLENGMSGIYNERRGMVVVNARSSSALQALWKQHGSYAVQEQKDIVRKQVRADAELARKQKQLSELAERADTVAWLAENFGADAFNDYNRLAMAKYVRGESKKFEGQLSPRAYGGFFKLGAVIERDGGVSNATAGYRLALTVKHDDTQGMEILKAFFHRDVLGQLYAKCGGDTQKFHTRLAINVELAALSQKLGRVLELPDDPNEWDAWFEQLKQEVMMLDVQLMKRAGDNVKNRKRSKTVSSDGQRDNYHRGRRKS